MDVPETRYTKTADGVHIAYQAFGEGPIDILFVLGWVTHIERMWDQPLIARFLERLASFARVMVFDKRGVGMSDRVPEDRLPSLEVTDRRRPGRDGRRRLRTGGCARPLGRRADGHPVRRVPSGAHHRLDLVRHRGVLEQRARLPLQRAARGVRRAVPRVQRATGTAVGHKGARQGVHRGVIRAALVDDEPKVDMARRLHAERRQPRRRECLLDDEPVHRRSLGPSGDPRTDARHGPRRATSTGPRKRRSGSPIRSGTPGSSSSRATSTTSSGAIRMLCSTRSNGSSGRFVPRRPTSTGCSPP